MAASLHLSPRLPLENWLIPALLAVLVIFWQSNNPAVHIKESCFQSLEDTEGWVSFYIGKSENNSSSSYMVTIAIF